MVSPLVLAEKALEIVVKPQPEEQTVSLAPQAGKLKAENRMAIKKEVLLLFFMLLTLILYRPTLR